MAIPVIMLGALKNEKGKADCYYWGVFLFPVYGPGRLAGANRFCGSYLCTNPTLVLHKRMLTISINPLTLTQNRTSQSLGATQFFQASQHQLFERVRVGDPVFCCQLRREVPIILNDSLSGLEHQPMFQRTKSKLQ
jgi:hypothetical protein